MNQVVLNELPKDWEWSKLGDVVTKIIGGGTPSKTKPQFWDGDIPWLTVKDMRTRRPADAKDHISEAGVKESSTNIIPEDTVIIATRIGLGKVIRVPYKAAINQDLKALVVPPEIEKGYLEYWFVSKTNYLKSIGSGTTVKGIRLEQVRDLDFPLAPPEQQKRIVTKIEELFSHIDAGIEALKKTKQLLKQYRQSVLKAAVTGDLLGNVFPEEMFKSIEHGLESLGQGWSPKCEKEPSPSEDIWGVIKTTAVQALEYLQEENKRLPEKLDPRPHFEVKAGDVLVTRAGPRIRVGVCCLVKETRKKLMICDKVYRLRPDTEIILPEYLEIVLNAPQVQKEIERLKTGISDSGVNLTQKRFIELKIPYPSNAEQKQLIRLAYEKTGAISRLEKELESQSVKAEKNKQSILSSAFSGRLNEVGRQYNGTS